MLISRHAWQPLIEERIERDTLGLRVDNVPGAGAVTIRQRYEWNCGWVASPLLTKLFTEAHKWRQ